MFTVQALMTWFFAQPLAAFKLAAILGCAPLAALLARGLGSLSAEDPVASRWLYTLAVYAASTVGIFADCLFGYAFLVSNENVFDLGWPVYVAIFLTPATLQLVKRRRGTQPLPALGAAWGLAAALVANLVGWYALSQAGLFAKPHGLGWFSTVAPLFVTLSFPASFRQAVTPPEPKPAREQAVL